MEKYINLMVLLGAAALSLVSYLAKNKERSRKTTTFPPTFEWEDDNNSESYGESDPHYEKPASKTLSEMRETELYQTPPPVVPRPFSAAGAIAESVKRKEGSTGNVDKIFQNETFFMENDLDILDSSDIINDFDLPSAIIYSEILRPKYHEDIVH